MTPSARSSGGAPGREAGRVGRPARRGGILAVVALGLACGGCSLREYFRQADRDAYGAIAEKQRLALGVRRPFSIRYRPFRAASASGRQPERLLDGKPFPLGPGPARVLSLDECLRLAARNSRSFQTRKEELYVQALELANLRDDWSDLGGQVGTADSWGREDARDGAWDGEGEAGLTFARQFVNGGVLTLAMGLDFATNFAGIRDTAFGSLIEANLTQPLLRGAWRGFAYEELYRAERDLALAVLDYERFTETFAVGIATDHYQVLQQRDRLRNDLENLANLEKTYKFVKAQVEGGMLSRVQADQAEQDLLNARSRVEITRQDYRDALDAFKLTLGIPIAARVELDDEELKRLKPLPIPMGEAEAVWTALRTRPDVLTSYADVRDAQRDVEIAADAFNPQLDLVLGVAAAGTEPRKLFRPASNAPTYAVGIELDYSIDQTDNRDAYRRSIIDHHQARRGLEEFLDTVRFDVRRSYRALVQSKRNYDIQSAAVKLAQRRIKLARLEQKEGLASTRDVLEAEDALRNSRNALTSTLINYVTTRLSFLATLGMIAVDEDGRFRERPEPLYLDRRGRAGQR